MIEKNINEALVKKEPSAKTLIKLIFDIDAKVDLGKVALYHQFPLYPNPEGNNAYTANVLFVSQTYGIIIFQCIEHSERVKKTFTEEIDNLNEIDRLLFAKILKDAPRLQRNRRSLKVTIAPAIFINNYDSPITINEQLNQFDIITCEEELRTLIENNKGEELSEEEYNDLKATIEGSKGIPRVIDRKLKNKSDYQNSKGAILTAVEHEIYNFDQEQKRAALFIVDGAQRIRGLAGSGKTVILTMKAAIIHLQNPEAEILYTYNTKSLNDLVKRLITRFYRQFAEKDPDWNKIHIMHAWGGAGLEGVYYKACIYNNIPSYKLLDAKRMRPSDPFGYSCEQLDAHSLKQQYDFALLDEAQDFPTSFYRICRQITKKNRVVWAYDDFQNILDVKLQSEKETFGKDVNGNWHIDFSKREDELQDLVLYKCYRNPRKILLAAFALGLGIYNTQLLNVKRPKIVQRLENNEHWESLGFEVESGNSVTGDLMMISRPEENSPLLKNRFLDDKSVIRVRKYGSLTEECTSVVGMILDDLNKELNPEDINVVCLDNMAAKLYFGLIGKLLEENKVATFNLLTAPSDNIIFKVPNHVSLSTIYKAKGNEAGSVYIIGIDAVFSNKDSITERNKVFTAMTRAQAWVTLTGIGEAVDYCRQELNILAKNDFKLIFTQPSEQEVITVRQDINKKQAALNEIERIADDLSKKLGLSKEEIVEDLKNKLLDKK